MLGLASAMVMQVASTAGVACTDADTMADDGHLANVCSPFLDGKSAYSVTFVASLTPGPSSQQIMVYQSGDAWMMRVAGFKWTRGTGAVVTKRNEFKISDEDASQLVGKLTVGSLERLGAMPYYGREDVICMDGASLELTFADQQVKHRAAQHSCAGRTEFNEIAAAFRQVAVKYDAEFEALLNGLKD